MERPFRCMYHLFQLMMDSRSLQPYKALNPYVSKPFFSDHHSRQTKAFQRWLAWRGVENKRGNLQTRGWKWQFDALTLLPSVNSIEPSRDTTTGLEQKLHNASIINNMGSSLNTETLSALSPKRHTHFGTWLSLIREERNHTSHR